MLKCQQLCGILTFMSRMNVVLSWVEHVKSFITLGPDLTTRPICYHTLCLKRGKALVRLCICTGLSDPLQVTYGIRNKILPQGYKTFFMLNLLAFHVLKLSDVVHVFILLIDVEMPTFDGILTFLSRINFMLSLVEHGFSTAHTN